MRATNVQLKTPLKCYPMDSILLRVKMEQSMTFPFTREGRQPHPMRLAHESHHPKEALEIPVN